MEWSMSEIAKLGSHVVIVLLFLVYLLKMQKESRAEREKERESLTNLIANDLSHVTTRLEQVNVSLTQTIESSKEVKEGLKSVVSELRVLHQD